MENQIAKASEGRQESDERVQLAKLLAEAEELHRKNSQELDQYREFDPDLFEARKAEVRQFKEMANRWTDNIFTLQSFCSNQYNIGRNDFNSQFGIPEELDYVE